MKILFNSQTNTVFTCGMYSTSSQIGNKEDNKSSNQGTGLGPDHLNISTSSIPHNIVNKDPILEFDSLSYEFKDTIRYKVLINHRDKHIYNISPKDLYSMDRRNTMFSEVVKKLVGTNVVHIKVCFTPNIIRFAGSHVMKNITERDDIIFFLKIVGHRIYNVAKEYNFHISNINYITLTFIPANYNLLTRYRLDKSTDKIKINNFIKNNFSDVIIPVSVNPKFLGKKLATKVSNGKFSKIIYLDTIDNNVKNLSYQLSIDTNLNSLPLSFKFYKVMINNVWYILGINYLISTSVRKVCISMSGIIIEDIIDSVIEDNIVKRVKNNKVLILRGDRVIKVYEDISLPCIRKKTKNVNTKNPNIGVIDFETYISKDGTNKIYASGFKTFLSDEVSMYYIEDTNHPDKSVYTNISSYSINIFNSFKSKVCQLKGQLLTRVIKCLTINSKNINLITKAIIYIIPVLIFIFKSDINYSFIVINKYIYLKLPLSLHVNVILMLMLNTLVFIITNISYIFIIMLILLNSHFLLINFISKHINIFTKFISIKVYDIKSILFTRLIALPFVLVLMYLANLLIFDVTIFKLLIIAYITQVPLSYINTISFELYKYIKIVILNSISSKDKTNLIKFISSLDFSISNIAYKVNGYNLFIRIIMIYLCSIISNVYIITIAFILLFLYMISYSSAIPPVKGIPLKSGISKTTATTLGIGTSVWSLINQSSDEVIEPSKNISIVKNNPLLQQTSYKIEPGQSTYIDNETKDLINDSKILRLLTKTNNLNNNYFDEQLDEEYIAVNKNNKTVIGLKVINNTTTCLIVYRSDSHSSSYYPTYYMNKQGVSQLYKFIDSKYSLSPNDTTCIVVFTQKTPISNNLHKIWRISPDYESFLTKLDKNLPKSASFTQSPNTVYKIKHDNTHFNSFEVVNALNDCLSFENKKDGFFALEEHYTGVFTEYLNYAKLQKHILYAQYYILGQKIDFHIKERSNDISQPHTYIERKSPEEHMYNARNQNLRYICIDKPWKGSVKSVYGLNTIGLNVEFNEYMIGNKGICDIGKKYDSVKNRDIEIYSIVSDEDQTNVDLPYGFNIGGRNVQGITTFSLYKEYGSLDNKDDSVFMRECRLYQLRD